jgi:hypothetical protein
MLKLIRYIAGALLIAIGVTCAYEALQHDMWVYPEIDRNAPIPEQLRAILKRQQGHKDLNPEFVRYAVPALVTGIPGCILFFGIGRRRSFGDPEDERYLTGAGRHGRIRQHDRQANVDFSGYEDCLIAFDTNVLLDSPDILPAAASVSPVLISKQVLEEVDGKKKDMVTSASAQRVSYFMDELQKQGRLAIVYYKPEIMQRHDLNAHSADQRIIGAYIGAQQRFGKKVLFVSRDRLAKVLARDVGLEVYDI